MYASYKSLTKEDCSLVMENFISSVPILHTTYIIYIYKRTHVYIYESQKILKKFDYASE